MTTTATLPLADQRAAALRSVQSILDGAKSAGRDLTDSEHRTVEDTFKHIEDLDVKLERARKSAETMRRINSLGGPGYNGDDEEHGGMFSEDAKAGLVHAIRSKGSFGTFVKAPTLGGTLLPTSGQQTSLAPVATGVVSLAGLFEQAAATGPSQRVYKLSTGTAGVVAEGAVKPDAGVVASSVDLPLLKLAATFSVSDELAEDAPFLIASIQRQVTIAVLAAENAAIVSALSGASGALTGTGTKAAAIDVLAQAIGQQEGANGITPSAVLMSPADIAVVRAAKASTGGSYILDPLQAGPTTLHGVPLTSTASVPPGTAYLVSAGAGIFYRRGQLRVEAGFTGDDWIRNVMTCRVEERVLPAVVRGELISKLTLT